MKTKLLFRDPSFTPIPIPTRKHSDEFKHTQVVGAIVFLIWLSVSVCFLIYFHFHKYL